MAHIAQRRPYWPGGFQDSSKGILHLKCRGRVKMHSEKHVAQMHAASKDTVDML